VRRIVFIALALLALPAAMLVTSAGADDSHTYKVELDNAFGLVPQSEVRIAGVKAGTVEDLDINAAKRAVVTVKVSGPLSTFREDATCSSQPQSLIAEYFLDCQPGKSDKVLPDDGLVPVEQTRTTVQNDLVNATLRMPFRERLALIINEFGTALAGNPENLNAAIRRGAPALQALRKALTVLGDQNTVIRDLNVNSDQILARLAERREDVVRFVQNANRTSVASAERRDDLERNFELLPGFLTELRPTLARLGDLSVESTPLLVELNRSAGQLNRLTRTLPRFNDAAEPSVRTLGDAAVVGRQALFEGKDEIQALNDASTNAYAAANPVANFLVDLDDPGRAVEVDARAAESTGRPAPTGYTGLEGLINYVYYQALAVNQFDQIGHLLHFIPFEFEVGPCGHFNALDEVPAASATAPEGEPGYVGTKSAADKHRCVSWVGPTQPGVNAGPQLPPYDPSVCPDGSTHPDICNPAGPRQTPQARNTQQDQGAPAAAAPVPGAAAAPETPGAGGEGGPQVPGLPNLPGVKGPKLPDLPKDPKNPNLPNVPDAPNLPGLGGLDDLLGPGGGSQSQDGLLGGLGLRAGGANDAATNDLLNYLFGS
jgi:virulence factor Mce-like protein